MGAGVAGSASGRAFEGAGGGQGDLRGISATDRGSREGAGSGAEVVPAAVKAHSFAFFVVKIYELTAKNAKSTKRGGAATGVIQK